MPWHRPDLAPCQGPDVLVQVDATVPLAQHGNQTAGLCRAALGTDTLSLAGAHLEVQGEANVAPAAGCVAAGAQRPRTRRRPGFSAFK
jgi:hypothetical protein